MLYITDYSGYYSKHYSYYSYYSIQFSYIYIYIYIYIIKILITNKHYLDQEILQLDQKPFIYIICIYAYMVN